MRHEPALALRAGPDGLDVIRRLLPAAGATAAHTVALEIGAGQARRGRARSIARRRLPAGRHAARPGRHRARSGRPPPQRATARDVRAPHPGRRRGRVPRRHGLRTRVRPGSRAAVERLYALKGRRAGQAGRGHVLHRSTRRSRRCRSSAPRTRAALERAAARRRDAAAAEPARPLPARLRPGPGDARPARARTCRRSPACGVPGPAELGQPRRRRRRAPARRRARARSAPAPTSCSTAASCPGTPSTVIDLRRYEEDGRLGRAAHRRRWPPRRLVPSSVRRPASRRSHDRPAARLLRAPARRRRSRGRRGDRSRARAPAADAGDDRVGELRARGDPRVPGQRADEQVRRGLSGQALLRRLRARRRDRAARDRPRQGAVRGRARERAAARGRAGQRVRLPRAAAAGRHDHGPRAAARRAPHATA